MRELSTIDRVRRIIEIATGEPYGDGDIVNDVCVGYAEPGYGSDDDVIVFGNWNDKRPAYGRNVKTLSGDRFPTAPNGTRADTLPSRLARALETAGAEIEWHDEWAQCSDCYRAVRTQADSYQWKPYFSWMNDCEIVCADCLRKDPESLVEEYVNEPTKCITVLSGSDLEDLGFTQENGTFENGWHDGQDDNPKEIFTHILHDEPNAEVVFLLSENSQFYLRFKAYVRIPAIADDESE